MRSVINRFCREEKAQNLVEWAILAGFLTLGSAAVMSQSSSSITTIWTSANLTLLGQASSGATALGGSTSAPTGTSGTAGSTGTSGTNSGTSGTTTHHNSGGNGGHSGDYNGARATASVVGADTDEFRTVTYLLG